MKASVIIPTYSYERFEYTSKAVHSLLNQSFSNKEIIVVVDRENKLYTDLKKILPQTILVAFSQEPGAAHARNLGVRLATGDIIAFIDDDIIVDKNWLSRHVQNYDDPEVIGVGGRIQPLWESEPSSIPDELHWIIGCTYDGYAKKVSEVRNNFGGNFSFRREVFDRLSFPTFFQKLEGSLRGTEDTQFCILVQQTFTNCKIVYDPEAVAYHRVDSRRINLKHILKRAFSEGFSKAYIAKFYKECRGRHVLSTELNYLRHLLFKFLPRRLMQILRGEEAVKNIKYVLLIFIVVATVSLGYLTNSLARTSFRA